MTAHYDCMLYKLASCSLSDAFYISARCLRQTDTDFVIRALNETFISLQTVIEDVTLI